MILRYACYSAFYSLDLYGGFDYLFNDWARRRYLGVRLCVADKGTQFLDSGAQPTQTT